MSDAAVLSCHTPGGAPRGAWWRIVIGGFLAVNTMTVDLAVNLSETEPYERFLLHTLMLGITLVVVAMLGAPLAAATFRELARGRVSIELLFVAGIAGALAASLVSYRSGAGPVYFEVVSILLVVYCFGRQLSDSSQRRALAALERWAGELSSCVVVDEAGNQRRAAVSEVQAGWRVLVKPGERVPVDGVIESGSAFLWEAEVTGESFSASRQPGDRVMAGAISQDGLLEVRATAGGGQRMVDEIVRAVAGARARPAALERQADRLARWFLPLILAVAAATFGFWWRASGWQTGLFHGMSVLLVACPCAMGFATPLAVWSAITRLAALGLTVKSGETVEKLAGADTVVFDKTGTLTERRPRLAAFEAASGRVRRLVAATQRASGHPIAAAFEDLTSEGELPRVTALRVLPGIGVEAEVEGDRVQIGLPERLIPGRPLEIAAPPASRKIAVLVNGELAGAAAVEERLLEGAGAAVRELESLGFRTLLATGDAAERARAVGIREWHAGLSPAAKREMVERLRAEGRKVLYVGDGVNDAAAMAASHAGIAISSGAPLASEVAEVSWDGRRLEALPAAIRFARRAVALARSNLLYAAVYNLLAASLAAAGMLHPVTAALVMTSSSLFVTWRASRLLE